MEIYIDQEVVFEKLKLINITIDIFSRTQK